jgi:hypothetical protein
MRIEGARARRGRTERCEHSTTTGRSGGDRPAGHLDSKGSDPRSWWVPLTWSACSDAITCLSSGPDGKPSCSRGDRRLGRGRRGADRKVAISELRIPSISENPYRLVAIGAHSGRGWTWRSPVTRQCWVGPRLCIWRTQSPSTFASRPPGHRPDGVRVKRRKDACCDCSCPILEGRPRPCVQNRADRERSCQLKRQNGGWKSLNVTGPPGTSRHLCLSSSH